MLTKLKKLFSSTLIRNIAIVGSISLLVKMIAFYKEVLVASTFGLSLIIDTFLIAILIPSFINNVFIGSLNNIFIPNYILEKKENGDLSSFQAVIFTVITLIMIFFILLIYLTSDLFIEFIFPNKTVEFYGLVKRQLSYVLPSLFFMGFSSVLSGLLEIEGKFFIANIGRLLFPAATIFLLLLAKVELGDMVLAIGFLSGTILAFLYLLSQALHKKVIFLNRPTLNTNSRVMLKQVPAKVISGFFSGGSNFVDQYFAAQLAVGSIAAINYGTKIPRIALALVIMSIGKVLLPHFSKLVATNLQKSFDHLQKIMKTSFIIAIIVCSVLFIFTPEIIALVFERNEFTSEDTLVVSNIQRILLIYIPFSFFGLILVKFLTTLNENKFMARIAVVSFLLNIILNYMLIKQFGLYGLAIATTIVYVLRSTVYYFYTMKVKKKLLFHER